MPNVLTNIIVADLTEAWEKEKEYGFANSEISPFGDNKEAWLRVIDECVVSINRDKN